MTTPGNPANSPEQVEELLSSPELAQAAESEDFRVFLDHVPVGIAVSKETAGREVIVYANRAFAVICGYVSEEINGRDWTVLDGFVHEDNSVLTLSSAIRATEDFLGTFRSSSESACALAQAYAGAVDNENGTRNYRVVALVDMTAYERGQRDDFERRIRDKDLQLKELQHRVKNNLQLITALIRLESRSVQQGDKIDLDRLAGRIESLTLLYRALEADSWETELDLAQYLGQIAAASMKTHAVEGIELALHVTYAPVSINVAMPVGLLVNELMTNAFKYAFAGRDRGTITIEAARDDHNNFTVSVADDGIGLAPGSTWPVPGKLAALILQTLRENTKNAAVRVEKNDGTRVIMTFTHVPKSARPN